ncbi:MAG: acetylglutamate kinase [Halanaerobiaceae bacterium]
MKNLIKKAENLIEALPYIQKFQDKTVVIKYGGNAMVNQDILGLVLKDIALLKYVGLKPVLVHGGGPAISENLNRLGIKSRFHKGLRVTNQQVMEVVKETLIGQVNTRIVDYAGLAGLKSIGLSGSDGSLIVARKYQPESGFDYGYVGEVAKINPEVIETMLAADYFPVIAPIGVDQAGNNYNINSDLVSGEVAAALGAEKLIILTNTNGILSDPEEPTSRISKLTPRSVDEMKDSGQIKGGMLPKVQACLQALANRVNRTHILDGRQEHAILLEIFTDHGIGTMIK